MSDLIDRQTAIANINKAIPEWSEDKEIAIDCLKNTPSLTQMGQELDPTYMDCVSRQAAIDAECEVCQIAPKRERGHNCTYYVHGCKEIECLRALPSAQPEIIRCKDCKHYGDRACGFVNWYNTADDFCSRAERRTDETD